MKSTILTRILGLAVAMQLVACAHEIPMSMEDTDAASNSEASESEQVWEDSKGIEPVTVDSQDVEMTPSWKKSVMAWKATSPQQPNQKWLPRPN